jgi:hypothetical protein
VIVKLDTERSARLLAPLLVVVAVGCASPPRQTFEPDPTVLTHADLGKTAERLGEFYDVHCQVEGVMWPRSGGPPDGPPVEYIKGADSALFTGFMVAASSWRYGVTGLERDLSRLLRDLRGLHLLTHVTGTPGVIARFAFPVDRQAEWGYPKRFARKIEAGFVDESPPGVLDPEGREYAPMVFYTRATRDQVSGLFFGLAVAWKVAEERPGPQTEPVRRVVAAIVEDVVRHLERYDMELRDARGENDTSADGVSGIQLAQVLALYRHTVLVSDPTRAAEVQARYEDARDSAFGRCWWLIRWLLDWSHNAGSYYVYNLNFSRCFTIWLLGDDSDRAQTVEFADDRLWAHVDGHENTWFSYLWHVMSGEDGELALGLSSLKSLAVTPLGQRDGPLAGEGVEPGIFCALFGDTDPYVLAPQNRKPTTYWTWQKSPWDAGEPGRGEILWSTGLGFVLPYWLGRYYGILPAE